jgi:uncharacterized protein YeaO (DUF488 family)
MLIIHTAQMSKMGSVDNPLDITVKSGDEVFAPTWKMVMDYKNGLISETEYTRQYKQMMYKSMITNKNRWDEVKESAIITLLCYCPTGAFCHRHILAELLDEYCEDAVHGSMVVIVPE